MLHVSYIYKSFRKCIRRFEGANIYDSINRTMREQLDFLSVCLSLSIGSVHEPEFKVHSSRERKRSAGLSQLHYGVYLHISSVEQVYVY